MIKVYLLIIQDGNKAKHSDKEMVMENKKEQYRIENIQKVTLNGRSVKLFKAYELNAEKDAYVFCGQFSAPVKTANKNLVNFIDQEF